MVAVASGKGGVGKSLLSANMAVLLATLGKRVVAVDAAFGSANLHTFLGVERPVHAIGELMARQAATRAAAGGAGSPAPVPPGDELAQCVQPTPVPGLGFLAGQDESAWGADAAAGTSEWLGRAVQALPADYVIIDLGSGTSRPVLDLLLQADVRVLAVAPEPTSLELVYRLMRAAFLRQLERCGLSEELAPLLGGTARASAGAGSLATGSLPGGDSPLDLYQRVCERDAALAGRVKREMLGLRPRVVINKVRSKADLDVGRAMVAAGRRRLGLPIVFLGHLEYDDAVWMSLRRRRPLLVEHPEARVSKCIEKVTRRLVARDSEPHFTEVLAGDSHYELLEVDPSASEEEIRRANRRIRQIYGRDSMVMAGLYEPDRLDQLHERLDEAYNVLMDPLRRRQYDLELFPDGMPPERSSSAVDPAASTTLHPAERVPPEERPPMPEINPATVYTGSLLQKVREARGLELRDVSERTKISMAYLSALESESFRKLPAVVYVRGFLTEYAKMLGLDIGRVLETYLPRYREGQKLRTSEAG